MVGKVVSHYKILEHLGGGGMGVVYKAQDTKLDRPVALKFLPPELTRDPEAKQRFVHEAKAASALQHNNICAVHDIDQTEDARMFIVMDYYEGETLEKKIGRGPLGIEEAITITLQIVEGLKEAHAHGIVHRDIKPANILVAKSGVVKILDFGLAKLPGQTRLTKIGTTAGTAAYMSPEQARGESVDHRTDIWSLGVLVYEMVTGQPPFRSNYEQALVYAILNESPIPPTTRVPSLPGILDTIIARALSKDPAERYQTALALEEDLKELAPPVQRSAGRRRRLFPTMQRRVRLAAFSTVTVIVVAIILFFFPSSAIPFVDRGWIVIADFENTTAEEVFDKALNTAFGVSIEQSRYINIVPRRRMEDVLRRMKKLDGKPVNEATAREIALREGLQYIVVPGISKVGTTYALTWKIEEAADGATLKSGILHAQGTEQILPALDEMSHTVRRTLGESFFSVRRRSKPLKEVTTGSIEALKQYSLGIESTIKLSFDQARRHYAAALAIDSSFTAARASLGMLCFERYDTTEGRRHLARAVQNLDGLTDKERYRILAFHARVVDNDFDKAVERWKDFLTLYPDDSPAHNNLGYLYFQRRQYPDAAAEYKEALRCDPSLHIASYGLQTIYLYYTGQIDSARQWSKRLIARDPEQMYAYDNLGYAFIGKDSLEQAIAAFQRVRQLNPRYIVGLFRLSDVYRMLGRYDEARTPLEQILALDKTESWATYQLGLLSRLAGDERSAVNYFRMFVADVEGWIKEKPENGQHYIALGMGLCRLGQQEKGWLFGRKGFVLDSAAHFQYAQILTIHKKYGEAIDQLELAVRSGFTNVVWFKIHPDLWDLRDEPRFKQLLHRVIKG